MELVLLARAEAEVLEAYARLEDSREGLGERFVIRVEEALELLRDHPYSGPVYMGVYRRLLVQDFPFAAFYCIEQRRVVVSTVADLRQDPAAIERKLRG